ncbi:MAG: type II toxin-antitoxin system YafQ family toxin [Clostridiales Family XIII bacterium]|nr:type II toxin-antitoxin system YafQ family toxin [Clostridiales Family XIII bacterium]
MLDLKQTTQFRKDLRRMAKRGADMTLLDEVIILLRRREPLPEKYRDHPLTGNWIGHRDCHIIPDWLLIYRIDDNALILTATRTGTHAEIFQQ